MQILGVKRSYGRALDYGRVTEEDARKQYIDYQGQNGHPGLFVAPSGFFIHPVYTYLGASPVVRWLSEKSATERTRVPKLYLGLLYLKSIGSIKCIVWSQLQGQNKHLMREDIAKILRKFSFVFSVEALESLVGFFLALDYVLALQVSSI